MEPVSESSQGPGGVLPSFEEVARWRPVALVSPGAERLAAAGKVRVACPAGFLAVEAEVAPSGADGSPGRLEAGLDLGRLDLSGHLDLSTGRTELRVSWDGEHRALSSRRSGVADLLTLDALGVALTGQQATVLTRHGGTWTARATVDLRELDPALLDRVEEAVRYGTATAHADGRVRSWRAGLFGQLGLRDLRLVTHADGTPTANDPVRCC